MGQTSSFVSDPLPKTVANIQDEILRQARQITEMATCSYEEFQKCLRELNELSTHVISQNGKRLIFAVKKGSDDTLIWRATVRVVVIQMDADLNEVEQYRLLTLPQFLRVFATIKGQLVPALRDSSLDEEDQDVTGCASSASPFDQDDCAKGSLRKKKGLTYSMFLDNVDQVVHEKLVECCICLERRPDVMLPCAHAYCLPCIEQWNTNHKSCPICRESLETTDDAWVISDIPGSEDISQEICAALMGLSGEPKSSKP